MTGDQVFFIAAGILCFCGGFFRWKLFLNDPKYRSFLGREGTRWFYMIFGTVLVLVGIFHK